MPTFQMTRYAFPVSLTGLLCCYLVEEHQPRFDVCGESQHPLFNLEKKPTFEPKLTSAVAYCRVYWAFISCIKAVITTWEVAHVGQFVWTNKDRQIGGYTLTFCKTISGSQCAWFKNLVEWKFKLFMLHVPCYVLDMSCMVAGHSAVSLKGYINTAEFMCHGKLCTCLIFL